uniref:Sulphur transport domain-containing protein n=1 Tax=Eiseniibacteriota bacterium TaxID=2212470 RepID=A0A832MLN1_UNCEI
MTTVPAVAAPDSPAVPARAAAREPAAYADPYVAGVGLGLVLLAAYVLMGRGLGASGAVSSVVSWAVGLAAPAHAQANGFFAEYLAGGVGHPLKAWLVFEVVGVMAGGFLSGALAGRLARSVERGPRMSVRGRLAFAFAGGALMGFGAKLARGCTSGQALSGGATLNAGSWVFMLMVFAGAYALAGPLRRQWR